mmetsp:Transcript_24199/g.64947  ORF Transcript_24199/g.64947 Transcript_24199/m.64947 type:complete len:291 (-) Transcript_24199:218-1090(-)
MQGQFAHAHSGLGGVCGRSLSQRRAGLSRHTHQGRPLCVHRGQIQIPGMDSTGRDGTMPSLACCLLHRRSRTCQLGDDVLISNYLASRGVARLRLVLPALNQHNRLLLGGFEDGSSLHSLRSGGKQPELLAFHPEEQRKYRPCLLSGGAAHVENESNAFYHSSSINRSCAIFCHRFNLSRGCTDLHRSASCETSDFRWEMKQAARMHWMLTHSFTSPDGERAVRTRRRHRKRDESHVGPHFASRSNAEQPHRQLVGSYSMAAASAIGTFVSTVIIIGGCARWCGAGVAGR